MPTINLNDVKENARPFLPSNNYTIRVADTETRQSQSGNPMVVLTWEIVAPESIEDPDLGNVRIAGLQFREYLVFIEKMALRIKRLGVLSSRMVLSTRARLPMQPSRPRRL